MNSGRIRILFIVKRITRRNHPWHTPLSGPIDSRFSLGIITYIARLPIFPPTVSKIKVFLSALYLGNAQRSQSHNPSHYPNVITGTPNNVPTDPNVGPWVQNCSLPGLAVLTGCLNCQKLRKMHDCKWPITVFKIDHSINTSDECVYNWGSFINLCTQQVSKKVMFRKSQGTETFLLKQSLIDIGRII